MNKQLASMLLGGILLLSSALQAKASGIEGVAFRFRNMSSRNVVAIYVAPQDAGMGDLSYLRPYVVLDFKGGPLSVKAGTWVPIAVRANGCSYSIVGVFADGSYAVMPDVQLCGVNEFRFSE